MVRRKTNNLKIENVRFLKKTIAYVEFLEEGTILEKLDDEIPEFKSRIEQATDKVEDVLDEENEKMEILDKTSDIIRRENRIMKSLIKIEEEVKIFEDLKTPI